MPDVESAKSPSFALDLDREQIILIPLETDLARFFLKVSEVLQVSLGGSGDGWSCFLLRIRRIVAEAGVAVHGLSMDWPL